MPAVHFQVLAKYNSVARAMAEHSSILANKKVGWQPRDCAHPNALEAMRWLVQRGNKDILEAVKGWKDKGDVLALNLSNRFFGITTAPIAAGSAQTNGDTSATAEPPAETKPRQYRIEALEGQLQATDWLREMRAGLVVDKARMKTALPPKTTLYAAFSGPDGVGKRKTIDHTVQLLKESERIAEPGIIEIAITREGKFSATPQAKDNVMVLNITGFAAAKEEPLRKEIDGLAAKMRQSGDIALILTGSPDEMQDFLQKHPAMNALIKHQVRFTDLNGDLLAKILLQMAEEEDFRLTPEAEAKMRHVLKEKRGGSGVARALLEKAMRHYAARLEHEVGKPDFDTAKLSVLEAADFSNGYGTMETTTLGRLEKMTGLGDVKASLQRIVAMLRENKERELEGLPVTRPSLHALFVGNPGTGKTTVANIYAQTLKELGYLRSGQLVSTRPSELVGNVVGQAETLTRAKLEQALGGVFFLDEAHNLLTGQSDYGKKALETILTFMEDHRDEIVVIFGGYPEPIERLLDGDPGLRRRFTETIKFADYSIQELAAILDGMVADKGYILSPDARQAAVDLLGRQMSGKDFGNAGAVRKLFEGAVLRQSARLSQSRMDGAKPTRQDQTTLTISDFEGGNAPDPENALRELDNFVGLATVKQQFQEFMALVALAKQSGGSPMDYFEPYFLFAGPPGTGKTSVAGVLGKVFHSLGFLPDNKVVIVNALDLMAGVVGQTAGKTKDIVESALGGVLFIDEIGNLAKSPGGYSKDTVGQLLTLLEKYRGRLVVVVAGYDKDINKFLGLDEGLQRRFARRFTFESLTATEATGLFETGLGKARPGFVLDGEAKAALPELMAALRSQPGWASGGDVRSLVSLTISKQATFWAPNQATVELKLISETILREAVTSFIEKKKKDAEAAGEAEQHDDSLKHALDRALDEGRRTDRKTRTDVQALRALGKEAEQAAIDLGLSAEDARRQLASGNPNSALAKAVARQIGKDAKVVAKELQEMAEALAMESETLGWICMFCGSGNPNCPYRDRDDREAFNALTKGMRDE